jgi:hypothetical protein
MPRPPSFASDKCAKDHSSQISTRRDLLQATSCLGVPKDIDSAIRGLRHLSPKAVAYCGRVLEDENEDPAFRVKVAIAVLDKTIPTAGTNSAWNTGDEINSIQIHIVHHERPPGTEDRSRAGPRVACDQRQDPPDGRKPIGEPRLGRRLEFFDRLWIPAYCDARSRHAEDDPRYAQTGR